MDEFESTVAGQETAMEAPADDAQAAVEMTAEEVIANLNAQDAGETAEEGGQEDGQAGDGGQDAENAQESDQDGGNNRHGRQIAAALRQQRRTIFEKELGESEETVRELIRAHRAAQITQKDPEITPKAARMIVEAQEQGRSTGAVTEQQLSDIQSLYADGWSKDELLAFSRDTAAMQDVQSGKSVRQAAFAYLNRNRTQQSETAPQRRKAAPIARSTAAGGEAEIDPIKNMDSAQYDRFMDDLRRRAMRGEKVRI